MQRRRFSGEFKAPVAREVLKERKTLAELAAEYDVHPIQVVPIIKAINEMFDCEIAFHSMQLELPPLSAVVIKLE